MTHYTLIALLTWIQTRLHFKWVHWFHWWGSAAIASVISFKTIAMESDWHARLPQHWLAGWICSWSYHSISRWRSSLVRCPWISVMRRTLILFECDLLRAIERGCSRCVCCWRCCVSRRLISCQRSRARRARGARIPRLGGVRIIIMCVWRFVVVF